MFSVATAATWLIKTFGYDKRANEQRDADIRALKLAQSKHFDECDRRHEDNAMTRTKVDRIDREMNHQNNTLTWLGDCIVGIGTQIGAKLPYRPNGR